MHSLLRRCNMLSRRVQLQKCFCSALSSSPPNRREGKSSIEKSEHIIILGCGIAGLSTARYLLQYSNNSKITLIDRASDILPTNKLSQPYTSYEEQICDQLLHNYIPSRRNGNVLCPSLTVPWTSRPLFNEIVLPSLKSMLDFDRGDSNQSPPAIIFDWYNLIMDKNMWSFGFHFLCQKFLLGRSEHESNKNILEYNMKCLDDPSDDIIKSIEYGRFATGTRLPDGTIKECDSSGDIGLFCRGLLHNLLEQYDDRLTVIQNEQVSKLLLHEEELIGVDTTTMVNRNDDESITRTADKIVVALGSNSTSLCKDVGVPCPIIPVKGHLVTISSSVDSKYNITLDGGVGYAAPMHHISSEGRRLYRLSGFVDFTSGAETDHNRVEQLIQAAKEYLPDAELIDSSACHRPISADDRPLIGQTLKYPNLYLCTGFGSRGWSIGLASGKLLATQMLGLTCEVSPEAYLPTRFNLGSYR